MSKRITKSIVKRALPLLGVNGYYLANLINKMNNVSNGSLKVLDIGSGLGLPWLVANEYIRECSIDLTTIDAIPIRAYEHGIFHQKNKHSIKHLMGDAISVLKSMPDNSFDLSICMDMIEHLSKEDGYRLLYEMNRISRLAFALSCPNGFFWQPPNSDNPFQAHLSGWKFREFKSLGFSKIYSYHGLYAFTGPFMQKKYPVNPITFPIYILDVFLGKIFKSFSSALWIEQRRKLPEGFESCAESTYTDRFFK